MNKKAQVLKHVITDLVTAATAWSLFYMIRKTQIEKAELSPDFLLDQKFILGLIGIPLFWLCIYISSGTYKNIFRRSRLSELTRTLVNTTVGVLIVFFTLLLDDQIKSYKDYYFIFFYLFFTHFCLTAGARLILATQTVRKVHKRVIGFNTILIGSNAKALALYNEMQSQEKSTGNKFVGFLHVDNHIELLKPHLPHFGGVENLQTVIDHHSVEEAIIAVESSEHENIGKVVNSLVTKDIVIKIIPDMYDIMSGSVKMTSIFGAPLIEIRKEIMPVWQQYLKRTIDITTSVFALTVFSPIFLVISAAIKMNSRGPVFYRQERIGRFGKPFDIIKFRSMTVDAENGGPALSSKEDARVTRVGKVLRKYRLDELPNFINVIKGEMSLVGPRPERQHFIDQIVQEAPHYSHLHKVRPGITSWGQVKYGYAENVPQMVERLKYDVIYIENMSLLVDFKILIYTILTVIRGKGK